MASPISSPEMPATRRARTAVALLALGGIALVAGGCGYTVGNAFQAPVQSVSVSIFDNASFRRGVEYQMTDAIHREIQLRWPSMKIVHEDAAESQLVGRIVQADKFALTATAFDDPRELEMQFAINVTWEDKRNGRVIATQSVPISPDAVRLTADASFAPETGQSRATAERKSIDSIARQIVDLMETPW